MRIIIAVTCLVSLALAAQAAMSGDSPEAAVRAAYAKAAILHSGNGAASVESGDDCERCFSRSLARLLEAADRQSRVGDLLSDDAARLIDLKVAPLSETGGSAAVLAEFARGDGSRERVTHRLVFEHGAWRIDDIAYATLGGKSHTLRGDLAAN